MNRAFTVIYRILLLATLGTIASYAYLIHEQMPLTYGELRNSAKLQGDMRRQILNREAVVYVPSTVSVAGKEECIGEFYCVLVEPAPLTPERIAAIKSNPTLIQGVRIEFGCQIRPTKLKVYAALERLPESKTEGAIWYADIPDHFTCECGITNFDLSSVKRNLFAAIGQPLSSSPQMIGVSAYERSALDSLRIEVISLLNTDPREEVIQQFIEKNPVILHQFPSEKLFSKPPIFDAV